MPHETGLIATVSMALVLAFVGGFIATRLHLPAIVGYLLAGVAVGPFTPGFVADGGLAAQLAEIGVILLMFGVGIHFSVRDLLAVRSIAIPGAVGQIAAATALSVGVAIWWGWSIEAGVVLGMAVSVASTVVLLRALMEEDVLDSIHGRVAVGWLIVEDIFTVFALVLLPSLASQANGGSAGEQSLLVAAAMSLGKVVILAGIMLVVGARVVPWLLVQVSRTGSRELFTLAVLAVALGVAFGSAALFGVSFALGAFLAGIVVGESDLSHQAAEDALPLRDAFAVLFFVSVGMLFDPSFLLTSPGAVLAVLFIILVAKPLIAFLLVIGFGRPVRTGLIVAVGLAQVGEFSFILGEVGYKLGLLPGEGHSLILAGALLSITLNPLLFKTIDPIERWLSRYKAVLPVQPGRAHAGETTAPAVELPTAGHVVLCGYGRAGRRIAEALDRQDVSYLVVEQDRGLVEALHRRGVPALHGDAADRMVLAHMSLATARALVIAITDPIAIRHVIEQARRESPGLAIVARTHSETEWAHLVAASVDAVMAEHELAETMSRLALDRIGAIVPLERANPVTAGRTI